MSELLRMDSHETDSKSSSRNLNSKLTEQVVSIDADSNATETPNSSCSANTNEHKGNGITIQRKHFHYHFIIEIHHMKTGRNTLLSIVT